MSVKKLVLLPVGASFGLAGLFFCYYTLRLIYVNLFVEGVAEHRSGGMYIGAVVFPLAAIIFGVLSWLLLRKAFR
jgi:hypothetical protein